LAASSLGRLPDESLRVSGAYRMGNLAMSPNADETQVAIAGLRAQEAKARLDQFGPNEPAATQHHSALSDLLHVFMNPLVLILLIAAVASAFLA